MGTQEATGGEQELNTTTSHFSSQSPAVVCSLVKRIPEMAKVQ